MNKKSFDSLKYLSLVSQLGMNVAITAGLCIFGVSWLRETFNLGDWIILVGILLAIVCCVLSFVNFFKVALKDAKKSEEEYQRHINGDKE